MKSLGTAFCMFVSHSVRSHVSFTKLISALHSISIAQQSSALLSIAEYCYASFSISKHSTAFSTTTTTLWLYYKIVSIKHTV